jgi:hypothetical protein
MKVIDLLNKIANGEELPNKFKFDDDIYYKQSSKCYRCNETENIFEECFILEDLDKEIEIIEEDKKIENIGTIYFNETPTEAILHRKIEEIINYINKEK